MRIVDRSEPGRTRTGRKVGPATLLVSLSFVFATLCGTVAAQDVLADKSSADAFIFFLTPELKPAVGDDAVVASIKKLWAARSLVGKTKAQAIDLLVADVRDSVDDLTIANGLRTKWLAKIRTTPFSAGTITIPRTTRVGPSPLPLDIPAYSPLTDTEMDKVMNWIAANAAAVDLPFCYRQTKGRTGVVPVDSKCPSGTEQNGLVCYPTCKAGYSGAGPVCWADCPTGFKDIGAFCQKPAAYGRGVGYALWDGAICNRENSQGCEQWGLVIYPKCKPGFHNVAGNICSPDCPSGFTDTGTGCTKPSYGRGGGDTLSCPSGKVREGFLCYDPCPSGFNGAGLTCWQKCAAPHGQECVAGCSTNLGTCVDDVRNKTMSVVNAAVSLATLGAATPGFSTVAAIIENGQRGADLTTQIKDLVDQGASEFAMNFADLTSPEINNEINRKFSPKAAAYIKKEYGKRHFQLTWKTSTWQAAKSILGIAALKDGTGLASMALAYANPICGDPVTFPTVKATY